MGIRRFREEAGTLQQPFGKERSSACGRSCLIMENQTVAPSILLCFLSGTAILTNPVFSKNIALILQSCIPHRAPPADTTLTSQYCSEYFPYIEGNPKPPLPKLSTSLAPFPSLQLDSHATGDSGISFNCSVTPYSICVDM